MLSDRFLDKVNLTTGSDCWLWEGAGTGGKRDYGQFWFSGRIVTAHRVAWILEHGPIPTGLDVCHHCDTYRCVNPSHLFLGTRSENMRDASRKGRLVNNRKTHCLLGHSLSGANLYLSPRGYRECRKCRKDRGRDRRAALKEKP